MDRGPSRIGARVRKRSWPTPEGYSWIYGSGKPGESRPKSWDGRWSSPAHNRERESSCGGWTMKTILENGARPATALEPIRQSGRLAWVDWARSFSSLTPRKSQSGLRRSSSDPDSRLCQGWTTPPCGHVAGRTLFPKSIFTGRPMNAWSEKTMALGNPPQRRASVRLTASRLCWVYLANEPKANGDR